MMYKTHKEIGKVSYIASVPLLLKVGIIPSPSRAVSMGKGYLPTLVLALGVTVLGYFAAVWGSGYPDIDHPTSIPYKKSPIIGKFIALMLSIEQAIKGGSASWFNHRGKFTHSLDIVTLTFLLPYILVNKYLGAGMLGVILRSLVVSAYIGAVSHIVADSLTKQGVRVFFFLPQVKLVLTRLNTSILVGIVGIILGVYGGEGLLSGALGSGTISVADSTILMRSIICSALAFLVYDFVNANGFVKKLVGLGSLVALVIGLKSDFPYSYLLFPLVSVGVLPGIDFFRTGDDSTWELFVRKVFKILVPVSTVLVGVYVVFL